MLQSIYVKAVRIRKSVLEIVENVWMRYIYRVVKENEKIMIVTI